MRALIIGADGFLGRALTTELSARDVEFVGINGPDGGSPALDIRDSETVHKTLLSVIASAQPTVVYFLAGIARADHCSAQPRDAVATGVNGVLNVLEVLKSTEVRRIVFPSTGLVYAPSKEPIEECVPIRPTSIYAATKVAAEALLAAYATEFGFSVAVARLSNVYGAASSPDTVVGYVLSQVSNRDEHAPIQIRTGRPVRDFLYAADAAHGLAMLGSTPPQTDFDVFNLSSGVGTSISSLVAAVCQIAERAVAIEESLPDWPADDTRVLKNDKIERATGWRPRRSLDQGLREIIHNSNRKQA